MKSPPRWLLWTLAALSLQLPFAVAENPSEDVAGPVERSLPACDAEPRAYAMTPLDGNADASGTGPVPTFEGCVGQIRPGSRMTSPAGCTFNFVFVGGGKTYIGTAGHCTDSVGQRVSGAGLVGSWGTVVYRIEAGLGSDFALVEIDADRLASVNPRLCTWGGPVGTHSGSTTTGTQVLEYGWGIATSATAQTRSRVLFSQSQSSTAATWTGVGSGGDSGAPVVTGSLQAWAIHTHGITPVVGVVGESGTYIGRALSLLSGAGITVTVATASP